MDEKGHFFVSPRDRERLTALVREDFPEAAEETLRDAEEIRRHVFDLLGSGKADLGERIDWHRDFKSSFSWPPRRCYLGNDRAVRFDGSDVKVPWDLASFLHLPTLGRAYWHSGDESYAREFESQVESFRKANPPGRGINWACPMKVAHRLINWVWGWAFFRDSAALSGAFRGSFPALLAAHADFVFSRREDAPPRTNHCLLALLALLYRGLVFPGERRAREQAAFARTGLEREIASQVYPDGADYEGSTYYHRFAAEIFLSALILGERNGAGFSPAYRRRLEAMLDFAAALTRPHGSAPQIGDADDGRVQVLSGYSRWARLDCRDLLSAGAAVFSRPDYKAAAGGWREEAAWLLGEHGRGAFLSLPGEAPEGASRAFPDAGFYILRHGDLHLAADCLSGDRRAPTGHRHNSRLSFELSAGGFDYLVDPGAYLYTADPDARNWFRRTGAHSTVEFEGFEQGRLHPRRVFSLPPAGRLAVTRWESDPEHDLLEAAFAYRSPFRAGPVHRRRIHFAKAGRFWLVRDSLSSRWRRRFRCLFQFAPGAEVREKGGIFLARPPGRDGGGLAVVPLSPGALSAVLVPGWFSPRYGVKTPSTTGLWEGEFRGRREVAFALLPDPLPDWDDERLGEARRILGRWEEGQP